MGDIDFIINTLEKDTIRSLYKKRWYPESLYLLGMIDYLSKINDLSKHRLHENSILYAQINPVFAVL